MTGARYHTVFTPEVVGAPTAMPAFQRYEQLLFRLLGIDEFLMLRRTAAGWQGGAG